MTRNTRIFASSILAVGMLLLGSLSLAAQDNPSSGTTRSYPTAYGVTPPLRELADLPQTPEYGFHEINPVHRIAKPDLGHVVDTAEPGTAFPAEFSIAVNFLGLGNGFPGYSVSTVPPDTNMAVGDTQIVQWVNTSFVVCDKLGICGPAIRGNTLWGIGIPGTLCATNNSGEPIAQWDRVAHRWLLAQNVLVSPYAVCIALSDTPDANGTYHVWQFSVPGNNYPDYQKWGVWSTTGTSNGYYQAMNNLGPSGTTPLGALICGYDRKAMLLQPAPVTQTCHQFPATENNLLPADVDSPTSPPPSQDEFFIGTLLPPTGLSLYSMNWSTGVVHGPFVMTVNSYIPACSTPCIPQKSSSAPLESVGDRLMYRFAYWEGSPPPPLACIYGCDQHWFVNHAVQTGSGQVGVRWYEFVYKTGIVTAATLAATTPATNPFQQQTYSGSPGDMQYRWMGSIARDKTGNVLLGYSESSSAMHPSIELAGRMASDPISQLSDEVVALAGNGSQIGSSNKWGEYSSMRIDPVDNCTFWYTTEYYMATVSIDWSTQIVSAKFSNCH